MSKLTDEQLMAYVDGELCPEEAKAVEELLADNPDAVARMEVFTSTKEPLVEVFNHPAFEAVPKYLLDIFEPNSEKQASAVTSKKGLLQGLLGTMGFDGFRLSPSIAFSALVLVSMGGGAGWLLGRMGVENQAANQQFIAFESGKIRATGAFGEALEHTPSSTVSSWSSQGNKRVSLKPLLSFRSTNQQYCRQYELSNEKIGSFAGLACRDTGGVWHIKMHQQIASAGPQDGRTVPANGRRTPELDAVVDQIIEGPAMGAEEEMKLIQNQWQKKP